MDLASLSYVWDGSQPGWRLQVTYRHERRITLRFGPAGPSVNDVAAMRAVFDEFKERTAQQVWAVVRGQEVVTLAEVFVPINEPRLVQEARERGLRVEVERSDTTSYLPQNTTTGTSLVIEDEAEAAEIAKRMMAAGVPVDHVEVD